MAMFDFENQKSFYRYHYQERRGYAHAPYFLVLLDIGEQQNLHGRQFVINNEKVQINENKNENKLYGLWTDEKRAGTFLKLYFENLPEELQAKTDPDEAKFIVPPTERLDQKVIEW